MWEDLEFAPLLTATNGPLQGVTFRLRPGARTIGRADGADILIEDPKVSRQHATVERIGGRVLLGDAGSTNGTWINDERIIGAVELSDGDRIRIGNVVFHFFDPAGARTEPVARVGHLSLAGIAGLSSGREKPAITTTTPTALAISGELVERKRTAAALGVPTQQMRAPRSGRMLLMLSGSLALLTWVTWAYLTF